MFLPEVNSRIPLVNFYHFHLGFYKTKHSKNLCMNLTSKYPRIAFGVFKNFKQIYEDLHLTFLKIYSKNFPRIFIRLF